MLGETFTHNGREFYVYAEHDDTIRAPWEDIDVHGIVSEWTTRDKRPSEFVLATDRRSKRYYDFAETTRIAKRDGWGLCPDELAKLTMQLGRVPTRKEIVRRAVLADFIRLRQWCNDQWSYVVLIVKHEESDDYECLGGIESDDDDGIEMYARELADQINERLNSTAAAEIADARPDLSPVYAA